MNYTTLIFLTIWSVVVVPSESRALVPGHAQDNAQAQTGDQSSCVDRNFSEISRCLNEHEAIMLNILKMIERTSDQIAAIQRKQHDFARQLAALAKEDESGAS